MLKYVTIVILTTPTTWTVLALPNLVSLLLSKSEKKQSCLKQVWHVTIDKIWSDLIHIDVDRRRTPYLWPIFSNSFETKRHESTCHARRLTFKDSDFFKYAKWREYRGSLESSNKPIIVSLRERAKWGDEAAAGWEGGYIQSERTSEGGTRAGREFEELHYTLASSLASIIIERIPGKRWSSRSIGKVRGQVRNWGGKSRIRRCAGRERGGN